MKNIYTSEAELYEQERVEVKLQLAVANREAANAFEQHMLNAVHAMRSKAIMANSASLKIDAGYDDAVTTLNVVLAGNLAAIYRFLDHKSDGVYLLDQDAAVSAIIRVNAIHRPAANQITNHLLSAAENSPRQGVLLRIDSAYDEKQSQLTVTTTGGVFAIGYLLSLVYLNVTQTSVRKHG